MVNETRHSNDFGMNEKSRNGMKLTKLLRVAKECVEKRELRKLPSL
jgi:hypothetical protein